MSHSPKAIFDHAMMRADHLLMLYDILHNSRERKGRADWLGNFKDLMHWPKREKIVRIDGKDKNSILILREALGITSDHFAHDYCSELLRLSLVNAVSAMDRYFHDVIVDKSWALLSLKEDEIPKELKKMPIPALAVKKALELLRKNSSARPGNLIKKEIQSVLHEKYTFQGSGSLEKAFQILGIKKGYWDKIGLALGKGAEDVKKEIDNICKRRNQIVHEADIVLKTKGKKISLREISKKEAETVMQFIKDFISEVEKLKS